MEKLLNFRNNFYKCARDCISRIAYFYDRSIGKSIGYHKNKLLYVNGLFLLFYKKNGYDATSGFRLSIF